MRRFYLIQLFLLFSLLAVGAGKEPFEFEDAVRSCGDRVSGWNALIETVKQGNQPVAITTTQVPELSRETVRRKIGFNCRDAISSLITLLLAWLLPYLFVLMIVKCKKGLKTIGLIAPRDYNAKYGSKGVKFYAAANIVNYVYIILVIIIILSLGIFFCMLIYSAPSKGGLSTITSIIMYILLIAVGLLFLYMLVKFILRYRRHLTIDEQGIRGVTVKYIHNAYYYWLIPKYEEVYIHWGAIAKAEIDEYVQSKPFCYNLVFYGYMDKHNPTQIISMNMFPIRRVAEAINYYYARYKNQPMSEEPLVKLQGVEGYQVLRSWLGLIIIILSICLMGKLGII